MLVNQFWGGHGPPWPPRRTATECEFCVAHKSLIKIGGGGSNSISVGYAILQSLPYIIIIYEILFIFKIRGIIQHVG